MNRTIEFKNNYYLDSSNIIHNKQNLKQILYSIDSIIITSKNTNPGVLFGGTWELIDKEFIPLRNFDDTIAIGKNATISDFGYVRSGHTIRIRCYWTLTTDISDATVELFSINLPKLGVSNIYMQVLSGIMASDGGNCIVMYNLHYSTGMVSSVEVINRNGTGICKSGSSGYLNIVLPIDFENMIDEYCNKFYWKRKE